MPSHWGRDLHRDKPDPGGVKPRCHSCGAGDTAKAALETDLILSEGDSLILSCRSCRRMVIRAWKGAPNAVPLRLQERLKRFPPGR